MIWGLSKLIEKTFLVRTEREPVEDEEDKPKLTTYQLKNIEKLIRVQATEVAFKTVRKPHIKVVERSIICPIPYDYKGAYCCETKGTYGIGATPAEAYKAWLAKVKAKLSQTDVYTNKYRELRKLYNVN